jgi:hypothetical protein
VQPAGESLGRQTVAVDFSGAQQGRLDTVLSEHGQSVQST